MAAFYACLTFSRSSHSITSSPQISSSLKRLPPPGSCLRGSCHKRLNAAWAARGDSLETPGKRTALPEAATYQQTLRRSFYVGGIGLHTSEHALVRVLPAFADEGRYFVRVAPGTNSQQWELEQPETWGLQEGDARTRPGGAGAASNANLFYSFVEMQEDGSFAGTFTDYLQQLASVSPESVLLETETGQLLEEQAAAGQPGEVRLQANVESLQHGNRWCMVLEQGDITIWGAEHLLAALECCGVDNARIEVEGGKEIPVVDGSALGWATEVRRVGLRPASACGSTDVMVSKSTCPLAQEITVRDGEAFITYYPGLSACVSVGVDYSSTASIIGRQWFTWSPEDPGHHDHFLVSLAPARTCYSSAEVVEDLLANGLLQGGPDCVSLIANKDEWLDETMVRFPHDEAARHAVVDLLGDLSLLASPGGRGLPTGHIVAYQPNHYLQAKFVERIWRSIAESKAAVVF